MFSFSSVKDGRFFFSFFHEVAICRKLSDCFNVFEEVSPPCYVSIRLLLFLSSLSHMLPYWPAFTPITLLGLLFFLFWIFFLLARFRRCRLIFGVTPTAGNGSLALEGCFSSFPLSYLRETPLPGLF